MSTRMRDTGIHSKFFRPDKPDHATKSAIAVVKLILSAVKVRQDNAPRFSPGLPAIQVKYISENS